MPLLHRPPRLPYLIALALVAACGGGDSGTTPTPTPQGFTVTLSATTLSVEQGASGSVTATIGRTGSFAGTVNLTVEGLPTGITAAFNPAAITSGTTSTTLAVNVAATVAAGTYPFTVRGAATGLTDQTAQFQLTVTAKPAIAMALSSAAGTAQQGANSTVTATITRTNFTGTVAVAVTGAPTGITPTVTNVGDVYTVSIAVSPATLVGSYPLTITASGTGVSAVNSAYALTVTAAPPASITATATPSAITMQAGSAAQAVTINYTRVNFGGTIVTAVQSGLVTGLTATVSPTGPQAGNTSTVTFQAGVNTAPGTYNVVVQGAGFGATAGTVTIAVTVTAAPANSISLTASPASLIVNAGGVANTATTTVTITRNNFAGAVTIAPNTGGIGGISSATTPSSTTGNTASITFTAAQGTTPGTYPVVITGSGTGIANATVTIQLQVVAPVQSITIGLSPTSLALQQGASGTTAVAITRSNFAGNVSIAATGQPAGVTITNNGPTAGNTVTVNVAVASNVTTGNYPITITASGTGVTDATATLTLSVSAPSSGGNTSWQFCSLTGIPVWFAAQNGNANAAWTRVTVGPNNVFSFDITTSGAVAYVTQSGNQSQLNVVYGTRAELNAQATNGACVGSGTGKTITGTVAGLSGALELGSVQLGASSASPTAASPNFSLTNVQDGNRDLVATRSAINLTTGGLNVLKGIIRRDLNLPNNSSLGTLDFGGSEAFDPVTKQMTITGAGGGETIQAFNYFYTTNGTFALFGLGGLNGATYNVPTVPTNKSVSGDVNVVVASGTTTGGGATMIRAIWSSYRDPANQTLALPPQLNVPTVTTVSTTGYARLRSNVARQTEYDNAWNAFFTQVGRGTSITVQPGYMGSSQNFDVTIPDFSGVAGWQNSWGPQVGVSTTWGVAMTGFVVGTGLYTEGSIFRNAQRQGTITP